MSMSEGSYVPPPPPPGGLPPSATLPPPPPPPPTPAPAAGFDFGKPFTFVFEDPRWVAKILIGGLFYIAGFLIIGWFFIFGYCARLARNVMAGLQHPLPEWEDLGDYFVEGLKLFGIMLVFYMPLIAIAVALGIPAAFIAAVEEGDPEILSGAFAGCAVCLVVPLAFVITFFLPAALLAAIRENRFGAAFELGRHWNFIRSNMVNYLLAFLVYFIARILAGFGIILLCIGVVFTGFWAFLITTHAFAQTWRIRAE